MFTYYKNARLSEKESFGDFCHRAGPKLLKDAVDASDAGEDDKVKELTATIAAVPRPDDKYSADYIGGVADVTYSPLERMLDDMMSDEEDGSVKSLQTA